MAAEPPKKDPELLDAVLKPSDMDIIARDVGEVKALVQRLEARLGPPPSSRARTRARPRGWPKGDAGVSAQTEPGATDANG